MTSVPKNQYRSYWSILFLLLSLLMIITCTLHNDVTGTVDETDTGVIARLYNPDGSPASGAKIKIFRINDTNKTPVLMSLSDKDGVYSLKGLSQGIYNFYAEKENLTAFQDSICALEDTILIEDDTLEIATSISAFVGLQPNHDPQTVTVEVIGTDLYSNVDENGFFTLNRMATGDFMLKLSSILDNYVPTYKAITIDAHTPDTLSDTLWLIYTGIPVVTGQHGSYDSVAGTAQLHWSPTSYKDFLQYLVYRDFADSIELTQKPLYATSDTFLVDTIFSNTPDDHQFPIQSNATIGLKYRVAIRNNSNETGQTYKQITVNAQSPSMLLKLLTPTNGQVIQDTDIITLQWQPITASKRYRVHLSLHKDFTDTVFFKETPDTLLKSSHLDKGSYFGRIKVLSNSGIWSGWLNPFSFVIDGSGQPILAYPIDTILTSPESALKKVTFRWKKAMHSVQYEIQISKQSNFASIEKEMVCSDSAISLEFPIGNYYWRCRSINNSNIGGNWSDAGHFGIGVFTKTLGDTANDRNYGHCAIQTIDNNFIILGKKFIANSNVGDAILVKISSNGSIVWKKSISETNRLDPRCMILTRDNTLVIMGSSNRRFRHFRGWTPYIVVKPMPIVKPIASLGGGTDPGRRSGNKSPFCSGPDCESRRPFALLSRSWRSRFHQGHW